MEQVLACMQWKLSLAYVSCFEFKVFATRVEFQLKFFSLRKKSILGQDFKVGTLSWDGWWSWPNWLWPFLGGMMPDMGLETEPNWARTVGKELFIFFRFKSRIFFLLWGWNIFFSFPLGNCPIVIATRLPDDESCLFRVFAPYNRCPQPDWIDIIVCSSNCRLFWSNKSIFHSTSSGST